VSSRQIKQKLPGYIAIGLLIAVTTFWTYWGVGEAYHEGWWGAWYNPLPYLLPAVALLVLTLVGIKWPRQGGWVIIITGAAIFVGWLVMSEFSLINLFLAFLLGGLAALVGVLFLFEARRRRKAYSEGRAFSNKWFRRNLSYLTAVGLPLLVTIAFSAYWLPIVLSREDDGDRSARLIEGNGVTLVWAPEGPGWNQQYYSWNAIAFYGVSPVGFGKKPGYENRNATLEDMNQTGLCCYLSADGLMVMDEPKYIWRMPTADEIVSSLVRHSNNAGCSWDGKSESAVCPVLPDKETPLWATDKPPIYYWAADEYSERDAYYVSYNGKGISHQPKSWGNQRHGYRFVREP
jgi:hypothetical protein